MRYKEMMYHVDFMIKELIRVSLLSLIKENKISVNDNNSYNKKDVQALMSKVKSDFNIMVDEGLEYYTDYFKELDKFKSANAESGYCS
ncbi:MAG: hypothetical protein UFP41_01980 [Bacilli bacterium]|nr:hypothetical protein [Bacilli bacterium]